ncbi:MAG: histidine kinase, partial [Lachnospiraceae bacterium]|nr:histidine kinase [Lachnospiraceae bacterium]
MDNKKSFGKIKYLCFMVFVLFGLLIPGHTVSAKEVNKEWGYFTYLYDNSNGLSTSEANAVAQMGIGFIWIGGYSGLTRYDGIEFHHFDPNTGIASVNCLYVDSKNRLWVGTNDSGLAMRQYAKFQFWGRSDGLTSLSVRAICEDVAGNIIIATTEGMAYIDGDDKLHMINDSRIKEKYVRRLKTDGNGIIYGCTIDGCFFAMENLELTSFYSGEETGINNVVCITPDTKEKGKVYIGTGNSEIVYGNIMNGMRDRKSFSVAPQEYINDIYFSSDNKMWICANNGLGYLDKNGEYVELKGSPMNSSITSIMEDREGNLWCTSSRQGVMKVVKSPFVDITRISGLDPVVVNTTCIYQEDLYIGTDVG